MKKLVIVLVSLVAITFASCEPRNEDVEPKGALENTENKMEKNNLADD